MPAESRSGGRSGRRRAVVHRPAGEPMVVDSSVFAAILLREPGSDRIALRLSNAGRVCSAPFFRFEVANALWKQKHWPDEEVRSALDVLLNLPVTETFTAADAWLAMDLARSCNHPFHDAAFVALAKGLGLPLWSLDARQRELAAACGVVVLGER